MAVEVEDTIRGLDILKLRIDAAVKPTVADVLGDWREEVLATVPGELRIYTTTIPARDRHVWLMQDPIYRNCVIRQTSGYYQCPTMSFDLATGATRNAGK